VRIVKILSFILVMLVLAVSLTIGWAAWRFRASAPEIEGQQRVEGLSGPVVIARNEHGVPHIFGASDADVFFGLGYAHAQDRLFQMDLMRRSMEGRLSEVVPAFIGGPALVRADARARILGHHLTAQAIAANFDGPAKAAVDAYVAGVNALLGSEGFVPPPEYTLLGIGPEPWDAADTAAMWVYMTDDLVAGAAQEYERLLLADQLTPAQIDAFVASGAGFGQHSLAFSDLLASNPGLRRGAPAGEQNLRGVESGPTPGSNSWVVDGAHTRAGRPLLANDPHLGLRAPNVWYLARLHFPWGDVVGGTIPGGPIVVLGRNEHHAWGYTNSGYDVVDYVARALDTPAVATHQETIKVRFGEAVTITVRDAEDGPILDPAYFNLGPFGEAQVVLRTTADDRDNGSASFTLALMTARSWDEIVEAGRGFTAPIQNVVYADVEGNIGYLSPGRIPIRDANGNWIGSIPYDDLPRVLNPASGVIATANNEVAPDDYPYGLPGEFAAYRISRIHERLAETALHDAASFRSIQLDVVSDLARRLLPSLPRARPATEPGAVMQAMLLEWSGAMSESAPEPLAFSAWLEALHREVYADELGELFPRVNASRTLFIDRVLSGELSQWCDDVTSAGDETCGTTMGEALDAAAARLGEAYGPDPSAWRWGEAHPALFAHPLFSGAPLLDRLFTVRVPHGGDATTINVGHYNYGGQDFAAVHAASMRAIYDLSDLDASLFVHAPGQSGNPMSPHYRDLAPLWAQGGYFEIDTQWDLRRPPPGMRILELLPAD
jgi:penicillin amidase